MSRRIEAACGCNVGRIRGNNEDNFLFDGICFDQQDVSLPQPLYREALSGDGICLAVFDGMGGGDYGEVASRTAAERMGALTASRNLPDQPVPFLEDACRRVNQAVCHKQQELESRRIGATLAALYFHRDSVYVCNVGDSRIFGLRGNAMMQISRDHTDEAFMKAQGITGRKPRLSQYLGMDPKQVQMEPFIVKGLLQDADQYLICSDGLTDMLTVQEIKDILCRGSSVPDTVQALIEAALDHGGVDNITVILCRIHQENQPMEEVYEQHTGEDPLARLGDRAQAWGRQLRSSLRDTAQRLRKR